MKRVFLAFLVGMMVMASGGYWWLHRPTNVLSPIDEPKADTHRGRLGRKIETIAVGEVVNGIRKLNRLVVFQAYVTATTTTHDIGWLSQSDQTMLTPAFVNYYVDMDTIDASRIQISGKDVYISRPAILIERPNIDVAHVQIFSNGIWSNLSSVNEGLRMKNNNMALKQLVARAKMPFLAQGARAAAAAAEEINVRRVLAAMGNTDVNIHIVG